MKGLRRITVAGELVERFLREGAENPAFRVLSGGLPTGARLVKVEMAPRFGQGAFSDVALIFEHESWEVRTDGHVPDLWPRLQVIQ